jgi:hypothetical protein
MVGAEIKDCWGSWVETRNRIFSEKSDFWAEVSSPTAAHRIVFPSISSPLLQNITQTPPPADRGWSKPIGCLR